MASESAARSYTLAGVTKLAGVLGSEPSVRKGVRVQVPLPAPTRYYERVLASGPSGGNQRDVVPSLRYQLQVRPLTDALLPFWQSQTPDPSWRATVRSGRNRPPADGIVGGSNPNGGATHALWGFVVRVIPKRTGM
jgi:hypothetical protein